MRFKAAAQNVNWLMVGSIATVVLAVVGVLTYCELKLGTGASGPAERDLSSSEPVSDATHESGTTSAQPGSDVASPPDVPNGPVALGYTAEELRKVNGLREMLRLEEGQELSSLSGVFGFVHYLRLNEARWHDEVDFPVRRHLWDKGVEVHKTADGDAMLLLYVDESTAARLGDSGGRVGSIFGFFRSGNGRTVLVGLPTGRIMDWEHRDSFPNGFAEIRVD